MRPLYLLALASLLAGCTVGPNYVRPTVDAPPAWRIDVATAEGLADTRWTTRCSTS